MYNTDLENPGPALPQYLRFTFLFAFHFFICVLLFHLRFSFLLAFYFFICVLPFYLSFQLYFSLFSFFNVFSFLICVFFFYFCYYDNDRAIRELKKLRRQLQGKRLIKNFALR